MKRIVFDFIAMQKIYFIESLPWSFILPCLGGAFTAGIFALSVYGWGEIMDKRIIRDGYFLAIAYIITSSCIFIVMVFSVREFFRIVSGWR